jgi:DHA1 family bicyclomycin/chloramphenicol resistance-like MFS transporter
MIYGALVTQSVIVVFLICSINKLLGLYETIAMLFLFLACLGISNPNTAGLTLAPLQKRRKRLCFDGRYPIRLRCFASFAVGVLLRIPWFPWW